jgi:DNA-binding response OmpR family regulator
VESEEDASVANRKRVRDVMAGFQVRLELSDATDVVTRIETSCPRILLTDTDLLGCPADLCRFARSLRSDMNVIALAYLWSEREEALRACADAVLHKPPRRREWQVTLTRLGVPPLILPAPETARVA